VPAGIAQSHSYGQADGSNSLSAEINRGRIGRQASVCWCAKYEHEREHYPRDTNLLFDFSNGLHLVPHFALV
jgi:hypothetical protein